MFDSEDMLTQAFDDAMQNSNSPFVAQKLAKEFDYREGRTDVIVSDHEGCLLAFEMKLIKWKQALQQAYRNSSFAHYSYVVVPNDTANRAVKHDWEFVRRGVGLCSINGSQIQIMIEAAWTKPLRPWLTESALEFIWGESWLARGDLNQ